MFGSTLEGTRQETGGVTGEGKSVEVESQRAIGRLWLELRGVGGYGLGCHQSRGASNM